VNAIDKGHALARDIQMSINLGECLHLIFIEHHKTGVDIAVFLHSRHTRQSRSGAALAVGTINITDSGKQRTNIFVKISTGSLLIVGLVAGNDTLTVRARLLPRMPCLASAKIVQSLVKFMLTL
jgi:hypothetical protein